MSSGAQRVVQTLLEVNGNKGTKRKTEQLDAINKKSTYRCGAARRGVPLPREISVSANLCVQFYSPF